MAVSSHLFFFFILVTLSLAKHSATAVKGQCLDDQKELLLHLRSELVVISSLVWGNQTDDRSKSYGLVTWNRTDDCCEWDGVGCDGGGRVIGLYLSEGGISGGIGDSSSLFRLTNLSELDLSFNYFTTAHIPNQFHRLPNLTHLDFIAAGFIGPIPSTLSNLNFLTGSIPLFHLCNKLETISLSDNNLLGSLSHLHFQALTNLSYLDLSFNSLSGTIPHHLFTLPSIRDLDLSENQFSGQINEFPIVNVSNLDSLHLSGNRIEGPIANSFFQLQSLGLLDLSDNMVDGTFKLQKIKGHPVLGFLDLSHNMNLSIETTNINSSLHGFPQLFVLHLSSCNLYDFPSLRNLSSLWLLDLSNNHIAGDIPNWIWGMHLGNLDLSLNHLTGLQKPYHIPASLEFLDLHSNQLRFELPLLPQANKLAVLVLADNGVSGTIPTSICNARFLVVLDLSFNNLRGRIPPCLFEKTLRYQVLNLGGNDFNGVIPDHFSRYCGLKTFDVSDNNLGGKIPKSLANCKDLAVMNVGNNNFDDSFPCMLPLSLHILVLRSNKFHGDLTCHKSWPNLQILDISLNNFSGTLDPLNFSSWRGMMLQSPAHLMPKCFIFDYLSPNRYYRDEVTVTVKGIWVQLVKIWPDFTSIDLSCNNFEGEIPDAIGNLTSLYLLNLSHNALIGAIPKSLGALMELGSLDLSANQLRGRIPEELTKLTFLSVLNVSYNDLTGMIPTGPQFQTFPADSFEGNLGLCGFPLDKSCISPPHGSGLTPSESEDDEIEWGYVFAALGYVVGLGSIAWTLLCHRSFRERYFEKIEEVVDKIFYERARRRRRERIRRRVEKRNEARRRHQ